MQPREAIDPRPTPAVGEPTVGLNDAEKKVLDHVSRAYGEYLALPDRDCCDDSELCEAVHRFQNVIAMRVARRADPGFWKLPDGGWAPIHSMAWSLREEANRRAKEGPPKLPDLHAEPKIVKEIYEVGE